MLPPTLAPHPPAAEEALVSLAARAGALVQAAQGISYIWIILGRKKNTQSSPRPHPPLQEIQSRGSHGQIMKLNMDVINPILGSGFTSTNCNSIARVFLQSSKTNECVKYSDIFVHFDNILLWIINLFCSDK